MSTKNVLTVALEERVSDEAVRTAAGALVLVDHALDDDGVGAALLQVAAKFWKRQEQMKISCIF